MIDALERFKNNPYKAEIAREIPEGEPITLYTIGEFTDLCRGGHLHRTGEIGAFRPGVGMIASRLNVPVVPVRIEGLDKVLHHSWKMAKPGRIRIVRNGSWKWRV